MIESEPLVAFNDAARLFPVRPCYSTLWRWSTRGVNSVRLETVKCGGRMYTSEGAVRRFIAATTAARDRPRPRARSSKSTSIAFANDVFDEAGPSTNSRLRVANAMAELAVDGI